MGFRTHLVARIGKLLLLLFNIGIQLLELKPARFKFLGECLEVALAFVASGNRTLHIDNTHFDSGCSCQR